MPDPNPPVSFETTRGYPPCHWRYTSGWHWLRDITTDESFLAFWDWGNQAWCSDRYPDVPAQFMCWQPADGEGEDRFAEWLGPADAFCVEQDRRNRRDSFHGLARSSLARFWGRGAFGGRFSTEPRSRSDPKAQAGAGSD